MEPESYPEPNIRERAEFQTTHWSVVLRAQQTDAWESARALEALCRVYWYPVYAFIRRRGHEPHSAEDLTQGFFEKLLEKNYLKVANPTEGRFRSFLLTAVTRYLANEWDRSQAQKRGGGLQFISLDDQNAEEWYTRELNHELSPEKLYERRWVEVLLKSVMDRLQNEYTRLGQDSRFAELKGFLLAAPEATSYAASAARLRISEVGSALGGVPHAAIIWRIFASGDCPNRRDAG